MLTVAPTRTPRAGDGEVPFQVCSASTTQTDSSVAVREIAERVLTHPDLLLIFVSPTYDLNELGPILELAFPGTVVVGCTSSGLLSRLGYQPRGMTAIAFHGTLEVCHFLIEPLDKIYDNMKHLTESVVDFRADSATDHHTFGFLMADGLSMAEEELAASLQAAVPTIPIIGGSAGDDLEFDQTHVLVDGRFRTNTAVLIIVTLPVPFELLSISHHRPTETRMVITAASPDERLVTEINGRPAAEVYAEIVGVPIGELGPETFSRHPVMLQIRDEHYIRSIQKLEPGGGMRFFCAVEKGLVLRLAEPSRVMESLQTSFDECATSLGEPDVVIGCDCILRRLELEALGLADEVGGFMASQKVVGFSTYGEQLRGVHVNQTFVGLALRSER
ncbi:MAG: FIST N-terminal domain-containing protein [Polyangiales bacterium]